MRPYTTTPAQAAPLYRKAYDTSASALESPLLRKAYGLVAPVAEPVADGVPLSLPVADADAPVETPRSK